MDEHTRAGLVAAGVGATVVAAAALLFARRGSQNAASSAQSRPAGPADPPDLSDRPVPRSVAALQAPAPHPE